MAPSKLNSPGMRGREGELRATLLGATVGLLPVSPQPVLVQDRRQELQLGGHLHIDVITRSLFSTLSGSLSRWVHIQRGCEDGEPLPPSLLGGSRNNLETPAWLGAPRDVLGALLPPSLPCYPHPKELGLPHGSCLPNHDPGEKPPTAVTAVAGAQADTVGISPPCQQLHVSAERQGCR